MLALLVSSPAWSVRQDPLTWSSFLRQDHQIALNLSPWLYLHRYSLSNSRIGHFCYINLVTQMNWFSLSRYFITGRFINPNCTGKGASKALLDKFCCTCLTECLWHQVCEKSDIPLRSPHDLLWPEINPKSEIFSHFVYKTNSKVHFFVCFCLRLSSDTRCQEWKDALLKRLMKILINPPNIILWL